MDPMDIGHKIPVDKLETFNDHSRNLRKGLNLFIQELKILIF